VARGPDHDRPGDGEAGLRLPDNAADVWIFRPAPETPGRTTKHQLVEQVKQVIESTALLAVDPLDESQLAEVAAVTRLAATLADRLGALPRLREGAAAAGGDDARLTERSGISGRSNPLAAPLHLDVGQDRVRGWAVYPAPYEGPPGCVHGGFVAAAFDDLLGVAQMLSGTAGFTGTLTVRMRRPTPLHRRIDYEGGVTSLDGRKIRCWGTASHGEELLAEADGLFIAPRGDSHDERVDRMKAGARWAMEGGAPGGGG